MLTLVDRGGSAAGIIIPLGATEVERFAARELARYLHLVSGATLPVWLGPPEPRPVPAVYVAAAVTWPDAPAAPAHPQGFAIRSTEDALYLVGRRPEGALWAVYAFLEDVLGVGFVGLGPHGDEVPTETTLVVPPLDRREEPASPYRGLMVSGNEEDAASDGAAISPLHVDRIDWMAKHRLNRLLVHAGRFDADDVERHLVPAAHERGIAIEWAHHDMGTWLPSRTYGREHPEYYAVRNALRADDRAPQLCLCTSNPSVVREVSANILRFWRERPWADVVGLWPNDGYGMCECDRCAALDRYDAESNHESAHFPGTGDPIPVTTVDRNKTNRYVRFLNEVAERITAERSRARISALFYVDMARPAPDFDLHPAIDPMVALYWRCSAHALDDPDCATNRYFARLVAEWQVYAPGRVSFYEYYMGMDEYSSMPFPILRTLQADWRRYVPAGVAGACIQSAGSHHVAYGLNYAAFAALAWDPATDLAAFAERWFRAGYGPAAPAVAGWWGVLESRMGAIAAAAAPHTSDRRRPSCYRPTRLDFPSLWDQGHMAPLGLALDQAATLDGHTHGTRRRLDQMRAYHAYCVAAAETFARERRAREAVDAAETADGRRTPEELAALRIAAGARENVTNGFDRLAAYVRHIADPTIIARRRVLARLDRLRAEWGP